MLSGRNNQDPVSEEQKRAFMAELLGEEGVQDEEEDGVVEVSSWETGDGEKFGVVKKVVPKKPEPAPSQTFNTDSSEDLLSPPALPPKPTTTNERHTLPPQSAAPIVEQTMSAPSSRRQTTTLPVAAQAPAQAKKNEWRLFGSWLGSNATPSNVTNESPRQVNLKRDTLKKNLEEGDMAGAKFILDQERDIKAVLFDFIENKEAVALNGYLLINEADTLPRPLYAALRRKIEEFVAKDDGNNYLHLAAQSGCEELLKFCCKSNLIYKVNNQNHKKETPLYLAYINQQVNTVDILQGVGAIDDVISNMTTHALFELIGMDAFSLADLKVKLHDAKKFGFTLEKTNTNGDNLFHLLAKKKNKEALLFLAQLEPQAYALNAKNNLNETPLSILIDQDEVELIKTLEGTPTAICGDDNLKPLAYAIHAKAFNTVNYLLEVNKEQVDAVGKDNISALDEARKITDDTIRLQLLPRLYVFSKLAVTELENAIKNSDKNKVQQMLEEGMKLEYVDANCQQKWQENLMQLNYTKNLQEWATNLKADHPDIQLLNDNIKLLAKGRDRTSKELQTFITNLYLFRDDLRAEIDGLRTSSKHIHKLNVTGLNALPPVQRAKEAALFVRKLIEAEKSENSVEGMIVQGRVKAIVEFEAKFKRTFGWKSYAKALGILILSAATFVGTGAFLLMALPLAGVMVPLPVTVVSSALVGLGTFAGGMFAISRRPYLTHQGFKVAAKAREFVDASQQEAKPALLI